MNKQDKIHILSQELIPVMDDLDEEARNIVLEHMQHCKKCQTFYSSIAEIDEYAPQTPFPDEVEMKPLKKLVQFNQGLKLVLLMIRIIILAFIFYSAVQFYDWTLAAQAAVDYIQAVTFFFYFPAALFLTIFSFIFLNKKWFVLSFIFDISIVLLFDHLIAISYELLF